MVFEEEDAVGKVLASTPHTIDNRQVDTKKAIPHQVHQVGSNWNPMAVELYLGHFDILATGTEKPYQEDFCRWSPN